MKVIALNRGRAKFLTGIPKPMDKTNKKARELTTTSVKSFMSKPKRLKAYKTFKPLPVEENEEFFRNGIFEFNVTKLLAFIKDHPAEFQVEQIELNSLYRGASERLNEKTVRNVNLASPVLLAEICPGSFTVIDGNHRVERARREGKNSLPGYRARPEIHVRFLTSVKAYLSYVEYWNGKLNDSL